MSLLYEIQKEIVKKESDLGSVLLKLRLLASKLGSDLLEEWVKHESEGYPNDAELPAYRHAKVSYKGTFSGPYGSGIKNAQIPPYLIEKHAGEQWLNLEMRESIAAIDDLYAMSADGGGLGIDASNLILLLQGKIYEGYSLVDVSSFVSRTSLSEIQQAVKSRILELTIEIEKKVPVAAQVTFGENKSSANSSETVQQITQQIIYGNVNSAVLGGKGHNIEIYVNPGNKESLIDCLREIGITEDDANSFANVIEKEEPNKMECKLGKNAEHWIAENLKKAASGVWKIGVTAATSVLTEAALKYYGLK